MTHVGNATMEMGPHTCISERGEWDTRMYGVRGVEGSDVYNGGK